MNRHGISRSGFGWAAIARGGLGLLLATSLLFASAAPTAVQTKAVFVPLAWPESGATVQVEYLGSVAKDEDLSIRRGFWSRLVDLAAGGPGRRFTTLSRPFTETATDPDGVEAVTGLGPNLFYNSTMESCIVVCTGTAWRTIGKSSTLATASNNGLMSSTYAAKLDGIEAGDNFGVDTDVGTGAIGVFALCRNNTASTTVASNGTMAGTNLDYMYFDGGGVLTDTGVSPSGTWRNISGTGNLAGQTCMWQRVS